MQSLKTLDAKISKFTNINLDSLTRISLAIIYVWFGALKIVVESPAEEFAKKTVEFTGVENELFILIGFWEIFLGLLFLFKKYTRLAGILFALHISATFLPFITIPDSVFANFPFEFTLEGQYVVKNLLLITAVLTLYKNFLDNKKQ